jgi:uncharacterized protein (UPF0548 family)
MLLAQQRAAALPGACAACRACWHAARQIWHWGWMQWWGSTHRTHCESCCCRWHTILVAFWQLPVDWPVSGLLSNCWV